MIDPDVVNAALRDPVAAAQVERALELMAQGARPDAPDAAGRTALHAAAEKGSALLVQMFLDHGGRPNQADHEGTTPLMVAVGARKFANADFLRDAGGDVNFRACRTAAPPLYHALLQDNAEGHCERAAYLLQHGADPDAIVVLSADDEAGLSELAHRLDKGRPQPIFEDLFERYTGRNIRREADEAAAQAAEVAPPPKN